MSDSLAISLLLLAFFVSFVHAFFGHDDNAGWGYFWAWLFFYPVLCLLTVVFVGPSLYSSANTFTISSVPGGVLSEEIVYRSLMFFISFLFLFDTWDSLLYQGFLFYLSKKRGQELLQN